MPRARHDPPGMITHEFPLRPDLIVPVQLPVDLSPAEAERLVGFVQSLVFEADNQEGGDRGH